MYDFHIKAWEWQQTRKDWARREAFAALSRRA